MCFTTIKNFKKRNDHLDSDLYCQVAANAHHLIQEGCVKLGDNSLILSLFSLRKHWNFHTGSQQSETHTKGFCLRLGYPYGHTWASP